jgi:hypothetical protein
MNRCDRKADDMTPLRVIVVGLYVAAVVLAASELGRAVGIIVAVVGAAFVLLAFAGTAPDRIDAAPTHVARRRRRRA